MKTRISYIISFAVFLRSGVQGQHVMQVGPVGTVTFGAPAPVTTATLGLPYTADETIERISLASGSPVVQNTSHRKVFRDVEGRLRIETNLPSLSPHATQVATQSAVLVEISDYVAGYQYTLEPSKMVAHRSKLIVTGASKNPLGSIPQGSYVNIPVGTKA